MAKPKDPQFPFEEPLDKARDMFHDGYDLQETLKWVRHAWRHQFDRDLTTDEIDEITFYYEEHFADQE